MPKNATKSAAKSKVKPASGRAKPSAPAAKPPRVATGALARVLVPSPALAAIVGAEPLTRPAALAAVWKHIRQHSLQSAADKRVIVPNAELRPVLGDRCGMLEIPGRLGKHLAAAAA